MAKRLLDQQVSLLDHLTSSDTIFGAARDASRDMTLEGIDPALLRLEARFSHDKRMEKIIAVFPRTFEILADSRIEVVREFAAACPPMSIRRLDNARQFYDFLCGCWRRELPRLPHQPDVATFELACARLRAEDGDRPPDRNETGRGIRRDPNVVLLRCAYDIRPIFEDGSAPTARDTPLAIALAAGSRQLQIFELPPPVFDLLNSLNELTDPMVFCESPGMAELIAYLGDQGLLEVRA